MRRRIDRVVAVAVLAAGIAASADAADREPTLWTSAPRHKPAISASAFADLAERARAAVVHVRGEVTEGSVSDADKPLCYCRCFQPLVYRLEALA